MEITQFLFNKFYIGFSIGFLGAFHCVGMCGPLIWSLPIHRMSLSSKIFSFTAYHFSRIFSYVLLGLLVGLFQSWFPFQLFFSVLSILLGILFILNVLSVNIQFLNQSQNKISTFLSRKISMIYSKPKTVLSFIFLGFLNGLLPCGLVYTALASTLTQMNWMDSIFLMLAFGLATFPIMLAVSLFGNWFAHIIRSKYQFISKIMILIIAILLIYRGTMGLMPSVKSSPDKPAIMECH